MLNLAPPRPRNAPARSGQHLTVPIRRTGLADDLRDDVYEATRCELV